MVLFSLVIRMDYYYFSNGKSEGEKYFHGGYWNKSLGGWVFSKKQESALVSLGASKQ